MQTMRNVIRLQPGENENGSILLGNLKFYPLKLKFIEQKTNNINVMEGLHCGKLKWIRINVTAMKNV